MGTIREAYSFLLADGRNRRVCSQPMALPLSCVGSEQEVGSLTLRQRPDDRLVSSLFFEKRLGRQARDGRRRSISTGTSRRIGLCTYSPSKTHAGSASRFAQGATSITLLSRIIAPPNAAALQCSDSSRSEPPPSRSGIELVHRIRKRQFAYRTNTTAAGARSKNSGSVRSRRTAPQRPRIKPICH